VTFGVVASRCTMDSVSATKSVALMATSICVRSHCVFDLRSLPAE
jgi:hypothetical protein